MIVACTEPERVGVRARSQGCGTRLMAVAGMSPVVAILMYDSSCYSWVYG